MFKKIKYDLLIITFLLIIILAIYLFKPSKSNQNLVAYIYYEAELIDTIELSKINCVTYKQYEFDSKVLEIKINYNSIKVSHANCLNKTCTKHHELTESGIILCLYNHYKVEVKGEVVWVG